MSALLFHEPPLTVDADARRAIAADVVRAETAIAAARYDDAVTAVADVNRSHVPFADLALRALFAESWARMYLGRIDEALELLERARTLAARPTFSDVERADVLFRLGCCRLKLSSVASAVSLFTLALELCDRSGLPCERLRARTLEWRSRCYQRQRDWEAARADVERALEIATASGDGHTSAHIYFQASLIAERTGDRLMAHFYAEEAKQLYEEYDDRANVGRLLNNLGGINLLLGRPDDAIRYLKDAFAIALEVGSTADAAQAISSLAQVHLRTGSVELAEEQAREALELLDGRVDFLDEIGNAQLVLGRSLLEQGRLADADEWFRVAEATFVRLGSVSHRAAASIAQGDLAARRGDPDRAAALYRAAAESLQDFNF